MKILLDINLSPTWAPLLIDAGFDAVHWTQLGPVNVPDNELIERARSNDAIAFSHDLDFGTLPALTGAESPSVFQIRTQDVTPAVLGPEQSVCCAGLNES